MGMMRKYENKPDMKPIRVTILLDRVIQSKVHKVQAKRIVDQSKSVSFSKVVNEALAQHYQLKNYVYNS